MRKVASLAEEVKRRRLAVVPLSRWSERRWCEFERAYGARKLAAPLRETFREAIGNLVVLYEKALAMPEEPSAEEMHDAAKKLRKVAQQVVAVGGELRFPRTRETLCMCMLVEIFRGHLIAIAGAIVGVDLSRQPLWLGPEALKNLAMDLAPGAWRYRPGPRGDFALMEFVSRLQRLSVGVSGKRLTFSVHGSKARGGVTYGGGLLEVVQLLQPALPRVAGSIAECSTSTLGSRLKTANLAYRRPEVATIP
jgi:hypothetical protein